MLGREATTKIPGLVLAGLLAVSCGGPAPQTERSPAGPGPSPTPQASPEPSPTPDPECVDATVGGPQVRLAMEDNVFLPACLVVLGGQFVRLTNNGTTTHNFTVEGTGLDVDVDASSRLTTEAIGRVAEPGTHRFFCSYHQDVGMEGEITVSAAG